MTKSTLDLLNRPLGSGTTASRPMIHPCVTYSELHTLNLMACSGFEKYSIGFAGKIWLETREHSPRSSSIHQATRMLDERGALESVNSKL